MRVNIGFTCESCRGFEYDLSFLHGLKCEVLVGLDRDVEGVVIGVVRFKMKSFGPRVDHYTCRLQVVHTKYAGNLKVIDEADVRGGTPIIENNHSLPVVLNPQQIAVG